MKFGDQHLLGALDALDDGALDGLEFGVIGLDRGGVVTRYNTTEARLSGLSPTRVLGRHFFTEVAPCTNNFLVAHRFETEEALDDLVPYVFTLRMKPRKVELRLLKSPTSQSQYLLVRER